MRIGRQIAMVFNLDKCLGCNTCTVACKNVWTNREGAEYMWWNNVETKPGVGYPREWENQEKYRGGWKCTGKKGKPIKLRARGKSSELLNIFYNPVLPTLEDYAGKGPFSFTYEDLQSPEQSDQQPVGRPKSLITGEEDISIDWGVNWEDNAAGTYVTGKDDVNFQSMSDEERDACLEYEKVFYFYLPRICNHCMNPGCVAACPSGAAYKREEDGIVLIDQDKCRAWRQCITSCPYKKTYYNWRSGKMEKCVLCFPRVETGQPPACFQSCPGRIRYMGPLLYDMDRLVEAAGRPDDELVEAQREIILDPDDPEVTAAAREQGIDDNWLETCRRSPVYKMFIEWKIALPLHPEFRTMPSLFYVPPESPMITALDHNGCWESGGEWLPTIDNFRIPLDYLASMFSAGNRDQVKQALVRQLALRAYRRDQEVEGSSDGKELEQVGLTTDQADQMYRLLSLAFYHERFVIPTTRREESDSDPYIERGFAGFDEMSPTADMKRRQKFHAAPHSDGPST